MDEPMKPRQEIWDRSTADCNAGRVEEIEDVLVKFEDMSECRIKAANCDVMHATPFFMRPEQPTKTD